MEGKPAVTSADHFDDVESGKYYENAVIRTAENNFVGGFGSGKFDHEDDIPP